MRITHLTESRKNYLYEGLDLTDRSAIKLWESAGFVLKEAALTTDQIQQIFTSAEQGATGSGGNRTTLGKGKDAVDAVNKAWEDLKTKMQNSAPVENYDQKISDVLSKIGMGAKDPKFNGEVSSWVKKYRKFAEEHPIAQGAIYATLIALAGISGAGLAGAATLGLLKLADKVLQGERFSSAAYSGAKTGAMAYGASKIGDMIKGGDAAGDAADKATSAASNVGGSSNTIAKNALAIMKEKVANGEITDYNSYQRAIADAISQAAGDETPRRFSMTAQKLLTMKLKNLAAQAAGGEISGSGPDLAAAAVKALNSGIERTGNKLSEGQIYMIFNRIATQQLTEGPMWDKVKGAVGGAASKAMTTAKTVGTNLTTKVTADKLNSAWKAAGSPMDSDAVADVLKQSGVDDQIVGKVYTDLKLPAPGSAPSENPQATPADAKKAETGYSQVKASISKMNKKERQRLLAYMQKTMAKA